MILNCTQYRFFRVDPKAEMLQRMVRIIPKAEKLLDVVPRLQSVCESDSTMFCHEVAHCMDLVEKGREDKLILENFGWPRIISQKWSARMADNEARVFTYQWLLQEELGYSHKSDLLSPEPAAAFLAGITHYELKKKYFFTLFESLKMQLEPNWRETLDKTINYIVAAVDNERSKT